MGLTTRELLPFSFCLWLRIGPHLQAMSTYISMCECFLKVDSRFHQFQFLELFGTTRGNTKHELLNTFGCTTETSEKRALNSSVYSRTSLRDYPPYSKRPLFQNTNFFSSQITVIRRHADSLSLISLGAQKLSVVTFFALLVNIEDVNVTNRMFFPV